MNTTYTPAPTDPALPDTDNQRTKRNVRNRDNK